MPGSHPSTSSDTSDSRPAPQGHAGHLLELVAAGAARRLDGDAVCHGHEAAGEWLGIAGLEGSDTVLRPDLANELKDRGIRVNAISPGTIDTPGLDAVAVGDAPLTKAQFAAGVPLGRIGRPDEVADVVAFLASEQSSFILGANQYVDGGENRT